MRRWVTVLVAVLAVLDVAVLAVGYRSRSGVLPAFSAPEASYSMIPADEPGSTSTPGAETSLVGPVLMAVDAEGLVLRATRGACEARFENPAQIAVGSVSTAAMTPANLPDLAEVLGVAILPGDHLRVSGLDHLCQEMTVDSKDSGETWQTLDENQPAGVWRFDPDTTAESVTGPAGSRVPVACPPLSMTNFPDRRGAITCQGGAINVLTPGAGPAALSANGFENLTVAAAPRADRYFVFGSTPDCPAQVAALSGVEQTLIQLDCLDVDGAAPQAIAAAEGYVVVQVGDDLMVSEDSGRTFVAAG